MRLDDAVAQYRSGRDPGMREAITAACTPLIRSIAAEFTANRTLQEDLTQVGYLGLLTAIEGYDPTRGVKFETYARPLIRGEMRHYLRDSKDVVRRPRWLQKANQQIDLAVARALADQGRFPTLEELATALNVTEEGLREILRVREAVHLTSLDADTPEEMLEIDRRLIRHRVYESFQLPIEDRIVLWEAVEKLTAMQRRVLYYLFFRDLSQPKTAARLGISQKHVSRVLASALTRLRELLT
ncbi:MAG: sigma-70 family RNA polymerase sigma factor [Armatimonadota bacterium]|nr:sigma-70 family RNA polymerase sigma factor [Armatimonadota bacterium]MDR7550656.1 sigma-70 family RNA polymerase sigma factor [Armatimonadota bacterium]